MSSNLYSKIQENFGKIICKFPILHSGWEMDGEGFVVEKENKRNIILTNHSNPYISSIDELDKKISEYKEVIQATDRAIHLLK